MTWSKRIGVWLLAALAVVLPVFGWLRERKARQAADRRLAGERARYDRAAEVAAQERATRERQVKRDEAARMKMSEAIKPHEARADAARQLGTLSASGDAEALRELAARLNGGTPK